MIRFIKKNAVFCIAVLLAVTTCFFVPPDREYFSYFDWKTLTCLFLTMFVICALRNVKFFTIVARKMVSFSGNLRLLFLLLISITFIGSMLIANDMALITFLPLGFFALSVAGEEKYMAYLFVLQNISANLGGMLTPFGNPQNLYLYSFFEIPTLEFCKIMFKPFLVSIFLLVCCCFFVKNKKIMIHDDFKEKLNLKKTVYFLILFLLSLLVVFRIIPSFIGLIVIGFAIYMADHKAIFSVDFSLLGTFFFFFIFAGNLSRIDVVHQVLSALLSKDTLLFSILSCQVMSNVPTAILLSHFTTDYVNLLVGVNIGGTGTLIASLASLITYSEFKILYPKRNREYLLLFTGLNFAILVIVTLATKFLF